MHILAKPKVLGLLVSGPLGLSAINSAFIPMALDLGFGVSVAVGRTPGLKEDYQNLIIKHLKSLGIVAVTEAEVAEKAGQILCIGWRSLVRTGDQLPDVFVIHDSLLPELRGWNPLVSAVELGLKRTGVTLFQASSGPDTGPIVSQEAFALGVGVPIFGALEMAGQATTKLLIKFLHAVIDGEITYSPQDELQASVSPWRNDADYFLDWSMSSLKVQQFILSRGFPYQGAKTTIHGLPLSIGLGKLREDFPPMAVSSPGKTIAIERGDPVVACGSGFVEISELRDDSGETYRFESLRTRFGT